MLELLSSFFDGYNAYKLKIVIFLVMSVPVPFPVFISKEGKWFVGPCLLLGIGSQGKTEK